MICARRSLQTAAILVLGVALNACIGSDHPPLERGTCGVCRISLEPVTRLDFENAPASPSGDAQVSANRNGSRYSVIFHDLPAEVLLFDGGGRFDTALGTSGGGPGEYGVITAALFDPTDSLWVFDGKNRRVDIYSPALERVRSMDLGGPMDRVIWNGSAVTLEGGPPGPQADQYRARVLQRDGTVRPLVETEPGNAPRGDGLPGISPAADGGLWFSEFHEYNVRHYSADGILAQEIQRAPAWFRFDARRARRYEGMLDLRPIIWAIQADQSGHVWVIGGRPERDIPELNAPDLTERYSAKELADRLVDTVVEVLSVEDGSLVASTWFDFGPPSIAGSDLVYRIVQDSTGDVDIQIDRLVLTSNMPTR